MDESGGVMQDGGWPWGAFSMIKRKVSGRDTKGKVKRRGAAAAGNAIYYSQEEHCLGHMLLVRRPVQGIII